MPIPGLKQQQERYPLIARIRKGAEKTTNRPGEDLDYFRYVPIEGEEAAAKLFRRVYGDEPREIEILLPFDEIEQVFDPHMERQSTSGLQCRGDIEGGWHYLRRRDDGTMERGKWECPIPICEGCTESGKLKAIIPTLRRLAYVEFTTTSKWDVIELYGNLKALLATEGRLTGIPCLIKRRPREISIPTKKGRMRKESWLLSIEAAPRYVDAQLAEMEGTIALRSGNSVPELPSGEVDEVTGEIVDDDALVDAAAELGGEVVDVLQQARDYTTAKGNRLGDLSTGQLSEIVEKVDDMQNPGDEMRTLKDHCLVLIGVAA